MKTRKVLLGTAVVAVLLVLCAVLAAHWASRSETVLRWAVERLAERLPGTLSVAGLHGAFDRPIRVDTMEYTLDTTRVRARGIELDWSVLTVLSARTVDIDKLSVEHLEIVTRAGGNAPAPPAHLRLPVPVRIDAFEVRRLRIDNGSASFELSDIALAYEGSAAAHAIELKRIASPWGEGSGRVSLTVEQPFALEGTLQWSAATPAPWPVRVEAVLVGTLERIQATGHAEVRGQKVAVEALLAPFARVVLAQASAQADALDLSRWFPALPSTKIDARILTSGAASGATVQGSLEAVNALPGPLDAQRLPLKRLVASFALQDGGLRLSDMRATLAGGGSAQGSAGIGRAGIDAQLQVRGLNLRAMHRTLHPTDLVGTVGLVRSGASDALSVDLAQRGMRLTARAKHEGETLTVHEALLQAGAGRVHAQGTLTLNSTQPFTLTARLTRVNPADFGAFPAASVTAVVQIDGVLQPQWQARTRYVLQDSAWRGYRLSGAGRLQVSSQGARDIDARVALGRNVLQAEGAFGARGDLLRFSIQAPALGALGEAWSGAVDARGTLGGSWARPAVDATVNARDVRMPGDHRVAALSVTASVEAAPDPRIHLDANARALRIAGTDVQSIALQADGLRSGHSVSLHAVRESIDLQANARGGFDARWTRWLGQLESVENRGSEAFRLAQPAALSVSREGLALGAARVDWAGGRITLQDTVYTAQHIRSGGTITGLPARKLLRLAGIDRGWKNDLMLGARWTLEAAQQVNGRIELFRESGDLVAQSDEQALALGIERLDLAVDLVHNEISARAAFASRSAGTISARGRTRLSRRGNAWGVAGDAPATLEAEARLGSIRALAAVFNSEVSADGKFEARVEGRGTIARPNLRGTLQGEGISVEQAATGVFFRNGTLKAAFTPGLVRLQEFRIRAGDGDFATSGSFWLERESLELQWSARQLAAVQLPDLLLVVSGNGTAHTTDGRFALAGNVRADKGRVELREAGTGTLGEDVVVVGRESKPTVTGRILRSQVDMKVDLGKDFDVSGRGLKARITGQLRLHNPPDAPLRADGEITVVKGTYEVYGRTLEIDQGTLLFAGSPTNPALDIRALRKNIQVEAGVKVTGTARRPEVRLVSVPEVPDTEKLAWLTLGRKLEPGSQSDTETLQRYAAAMAATVGTGNFQGQVAKAVGLDEIVILPGIDPTTEGGVIQIGKRIGDRIYVMLEQRLSTTQNVLRVNYRLARDWSLRLESGETDAVDVFYSLSFD